MKPGGIGLNWRFIAAGLALLGLVPAHAVVIRATSDPVKNERPVTEKDREHWAFKELPASTSRDSKPADPSRALDLLAATTMKIGVEATAETLIRRVTFDLTGLPPTAAEVSAFVIGSAGGYEELVDRLLASPRYGEHWAQWWLDLARYAETDGFEHDRERTRAWQFRDWVIQALNADLPFDVFVQKQIAGDLMGEELATAFLFSGPDMPDLNNQDERRHILLNDITGTVGSVFLGLTVGCAQCHDHAYDPISQADFYRLRAFFDNTVMMQKDKQINPAVRMYAEGVPASVVFVRGEASRPGPVVEPGFPRIAMKAPVGNAKPDRLALAKWITSSDNALFLRAMANRIWQQHFGRPLAGNPGDLGHQGEAPLNPKLLDWLAAELPRQNWSLKSLHKVIVMSGAYRQGESQQKRLTGEMLRDALLAVAGGLNLKTGGESVRLPFPKEISDTMLKKHTEVTADPEELRRRSIYTFARRNVRYPLFDMFDRPDAQASCARRNESTTAPQALMMLNSELVNEIAGTVAAQLAQAHGSDARQIVDAATLLCLSRAATEAERLTGAAFLEAQTAVVGGFTEAVKDYCLALLNSNGFVFVD